MIRARQPVAMPRFVFVQAALIGFSMILLLAVAGRLLDRWARADIRAEAAAAGRAPARCAAAPSPAEPVSGQILAVLALLAGGVIAVTVRWARADLAALARDQAARTAHPILIPPLHDDR